MKRTKQTKKSFSKRIPMPHINLFWTFTIILSSGGVLALIRAITVDGTSSFDTKNDTIISQFNTVFPFEPDSPALFSMWMVISFVLISIAVFLTLFDTYYDWKVYSLLMIGVLLAPIFAVGLTIGLDLKTDSMNRKNFTVAVDQLYSENKKSDDIYTISYKKSGDDIKKINKSLIKLTEKNKTSDQAIIFNFKQYEDEALYPIFQVIEIDGESHLIASTKSTVENLDDIKDLGPISVKELSSLVD